MLRRLLRLVLAVIGAVAVLLVVLGALGYLHTYRTPTSSMEPALRCARPGLGCSGKHTDRVLALRYLWGSPKHGDVVAFHAPPLALVRCGVAGVFIKRVVALAGERVAERNGRVLVNGVPQREPYVLPKLRDRLTEAPSRVPAGRLYLLGDNRSSSCDSREWGPVKRSAVIGKVLVRYWPAGRIGLP